MNILFLTENFPPETNASATRLYEKACFWVQWGHNVTVVTCAPNFPDGVLFDGYRNCWHQTEVMDGIRVVRVKTYIAPNRGVMRRSLDFLSFGVTGFTAGLFEPRPDVVIGNSPQLFAAAAGYGVGALRRVPFVFELADLWPASIAAVGAIRHPLPLMLLERLELYLYRRAAAIIALTNGIRENLVSRGIPSEKISVVMNGADLTRYGPRPRDEALAKAWGVSGKFVVGYVGTHGMAHALRHVLDAAEMLRDAPDIAFLFVGAGAERDAVIADAERRGLGNVIFQRVQPKEKLSSVWSLCDIAVAHLKNEPLFAGALPTKMFEAMGMGLPVLLATPEGEASRLLLDIGAGVWVPPEDPAALAAAIRSLHDDDAKREYLAAASRAAAPFHSREDRARDMLGVLQMAAGSKGIDAVAAPGGQLR